LKLNPYLLCKLKTNKTKMYHIGWYFSDISICQQISPGLANTDFLSPYRIGRANKTMSSWSNLESCTLLGWA